MMSVKVFTRYSSNLFEAQSPLARAAEATVAYSDRDALHTDKLTRRNVSFHLQAQLNGLTNPLPELVERARLGVTSSQFWNGGHIVPLLITLDDHAKLPFAGFSHGVGMTETSLGRKAAE